MKKTFLPVQTQLVIRILYSYLSLAETDDHSKLCNPHIFLAIDEPLKTDNVQEILDSMSALLDESVAPWKYFSCLLTSLSYKPLANYNTIQSSSGRSVLYSSQTL